MIRFCYTLKDAVNLSNGIDRIFSRHNSGVPGGIEFAIVPGGEENTLSQENQEQGHAESNNEWEEESDVSVTPPTY